MGGGFGKKRRNEEELLQLCDKANPDWMKLMIQIKEQGALDITPILRNPRVRHFIEKWCDVVEPVQHWTEHNQDLAQWADRDACKQIYIEKDLMLKAKKEEAAKNASL